MSPLIEKLIRHALDPSASDGESVSYWEKARQKLRAEGISADSLFSSPSSGSMQTITINEDEPTELEIVMPMGKYKGQTLRNIYHADIRYLQWASVNMTSSPPLQRAIKVVLGEK